jgi:hypothetical protein
MMANSNSNKMPVLDLEREEKREENGECVVEKERKELDGEMERTETATGGGWEGESGIK